MDSTTTPRAKIVTFLRAVGAFLFKHHLPLGLIFAVTLGGLWPTPGVALSKLPTSYVCVIIIFLISGLKLKTDDIKTALKSWKSSLYGIFSILFLTSIVSLELIKLLGSQFNDLDVQLDDDNSTSNATSTMSCQTSNLSNASDNSRPLGPREFSTGLQVFFAMPCTVSSGVIMVTQVNGNYALSLLLTVVANLLGIATVPGLLNWRAHFDAAVKLSASALLLKLVLTLLIPLIVGKAFRFIPKVEKLVGKHRNILKVTSNVALIILPWMKISVTSENGSFNCVKAQSIVAIFAIGLGLHLLLLAINSFAAWILRLTTPNRKAVVILCSQKTLAVAISVLTFFPAGLGDQGLMAIPCIISHLVQIIVDALLVSGWLAYDKRQEAKGKKDVSGDGQESGASDGLELQLMADDLEAFNDEPDETQDSSKPMPVCT